MASKEPNIKDKTDTPRYSEEYLKFLRDIRTKVGDDNSDRANWNNKMLIATNQRLGVKRYTNLPYPGAPDIPLPETDKLIKKAIPNFVLSAWSPKKMCTVKVQDGIQETPEMTEKVRKTESVMNMLLRNTGLGWFKKLMLAADNLKQYGHCIFKIYEEYKSRIVRKTINLDEFGEEEVAQLKKLTREELVAFVADRFNLDPEDERDMESIDDAIDQFKSGETVIEFDVEVVNDMPQIDVVLPTKITVPAYAQDINSSPRVNLEYFLTKERLQELIDKEIFLEKDLKEIKIVTTTNDTIEKQKGYNEGVSDTSTEKDLYRINEICCWYKDGKKPAERKVYTFLADVSDPEQALLQDLCFPYEYEGWFYEKHDNEVKDPRYYSSRGLPEQIRALQEISERCIKNMIIRDEMNNTPIWEVLSSSEIMDGHMYMTPGQKVPVSALGAEIRQLNQFSKVDSSSEQIMQTLKAYTEEYIGSPDLFFKNATNQGSQRTGKEIQLGIQANAGPLNLEVISWNDTLSKVYTKVFRLMAERLGDSIFINGEEVTREDFNFPAEIRSNGDLEVSDQQMATQKSSMRLNVLLNPMMADMVTPDDRYNLVRDWLEKDGVKDPDQFITSPKDMMQDQSMQMKQQMQQAQQSVAISQQELDKNQKDAYKAKRLEKKHINQAKAAVEGAEQEVSAQAEDAAQLVEGVAGGLFRQ